jgi:hypothetical protein
LICVNPRTGVGGQSSLFKVPDGQHVAGHDLGLHNPLLERSMFSPDLRKLAAWTAVRGAVHVGWFEKFGEFHDVSGPLQRGWSAGLTPTDPQFGGNRYYFGLRSHHRIVEVVSVSIVAPTKGLRVEQRFTPSASVNDFAVPPGGVISPFDPLRPRWLKLAGGFALSPSDLIGGSGYVTRVAAHGTVTIARHALIPQTAMSHRHGQSTPGTTLLSGAGLGDPVVSPDGQRYAFTRTDGDSVSLSIAELHGGSATSVPTPQYGPSPFGRDAALIAWY